MMAVKRDYDTSHGLLYNSTISLNGFAKDKENCFVVPASDPLLPEHQQDDEDANSLYDVLEKEVIPMYYDYPSSWLSIMKNSREDIIPYFDSNRMAAEYYEKLYNRLSAEQVEKISLNTNKPVLV